MNKIQTHMLKSIMFKMKQVRVALQNGFYITDLLQKKQLGVWDDG
jgi:hypothetical protein